MRQRVARSAMQRPKSVGWPGNFRSATVSCTTCAELTFPAGVTISRTETKPTAFGKLPNVS